MLVRRTLAAALTAGALLLAAGCAGDDLASDDASDPTESSAPSDKGSVTLEGVSLTVSDISEAGAADGWFEVSLIPETLAATTLGVLQVGDRVNVETDVIARHVRRMLRIDEATTAALDASPVATVDL